MTTTTTTARGTVRSVLITATRHGNPFDQWRLERYDAGTSHVEADRLAWQAVGHVLRISDAHGEHYTATAGAYVLEDIAERATAYALTLDLAAAWETTTGTREERATTAPAVDGTPSALAAALAAMVIAAETDEDAPSELTEDAHTAALEERAAECAAHAIAWAEAAEEHGFNGTPTTPAAAAVVANLATDAHGAAEAAEAAAEEAGTPTAHAAAARARWGAFVAATAAREAWDGVATAWADKRTAHGDEEPADI